MCMANKNLNKAKDLKNDEFYTQLTDIEKELKYYKEHFKGKTIFCNCDDPFESNFFKYFAANFNYLGLKKLITTCYAGSPVSHVQLSLFDVKGLEISKKTSKKPYKLEITEVTDLNQDGAVDMADVEYLLKNKKNTLTLLKKDGDFRSEEATKLLKEADIVVTNPPFSLFREYVTQLVEYEKQFLIIGNFNAVTYKEIFPLIKDNKMWIGYSPRSMTFFTPSGEMSTTNACWFTNLDIKKRHEKMILYKKYNSEEYPKYDNYDAIEVSKVVNIPVDYKEPMGVPITFLEKHNPEQFKILGNLGSYAPDGYSLSSAIFIDGKKIFKRILIQKIEEEDQNGN